MCTCKFVQRPAPLLSMEAYEDEETPLGQLVEAAGRDEGTVWHRVSASSGAKLLLVCLTEDCMSLHPAMGRQSGALFC
jgi:hypothetical protein